MIGVAHSITGLVSSSLNLIESAVFISLVYFLLPNDRTIQNIFPIVKKKKKKKKKKKNMPSGFQSMNRYILIFIKERSICHNTTPDIMT